MIVIPENFKTKYQKHYKKNTNGVLTFSEFESMYKSLQTNKEREVALRIITNILDGQDGGRRRTHRKRSKRSKHTCRHRK